MRSSPAVKTGPVSVVGFLVVLQFASGVLQAWLPPLLPGILRQYGTTAAELNWANVVYLLSTAVCVPLVAKLGDAYGHRRLLIVAASPPASIGAMPTGLSVRSGRPRGLHLGGVADVRGGRDAFVSSRGDGVTGFGPRPFGLTAHRSSSAQHRPLRRRVDAVTRARH